MLCNDWITCSFVDGKRGEVKNLFYKKGQTIRNNLSLKLAITLHTIFWYASDRKVFVFKAGVGCMCFGKKLVLLE